LEHFLLLLSRAFSGFSFLLNIQQKVSQKILNALPKEKQSKIIEITNAIIEISAES
jgi:hypothetical protein